MASKRVAAATSAPAPRRLSAHTLLSLLVIAATVAVYSNSFSGVFLFDDGRYIEDNLRIRQLWPPWEVLSGRRPVVDLSLAVNYTLGGLNVGGYHAVNVTVHILAALTLFGIVRRTLSREPFRDHVGRSSPYLALAVALIWAAHPLQTQSVTYLIQRCESMMGLFYLLTLYCTIRGADSVRGLWWYLGAIAFCALGMGSKAVIVTAPVVVLLYDRTFISHSLWMALRRRWGLYLGLAATWTVLWFCGTAPGVLSPSKEVATVGFSYKGIAPLDYALTQPGVILHYLRLSFWPHPLCLDYGWPVARTWAAIVPQAIVIVVFLTGTIWAWFRKPPLGFVGAWFFLILAPTSSFIPIRDPLFEHRMYLSLAAVVVLAVIGGHLVLEFLAHRLSLTDSLRWVITSALVAAIVASLGFAAVRRNKDYHSKLAMWQDIVTKHPQNHRAQYNLGTTLLDHDDVEGAIAALRRALEINPRSTGAHYNLGKALSRQGKTAEAARHYVAALQVDPDLAEAHNDLGNILTRRGRIDQAIHHYREAVRANPRYVRAYYNLGSVLLAQGNIDEAVAVLKQAVQLSPDTARVRYALGNAYFRQGRIDEAINEYQQVLRLEPDHAEASRALDAAKYRADSAARP